MTEHKVEIPPGMRKLCGILSLPYGLRGVVAFAHGSGNGRFALFAAALVRTIATQFPTRPHYASAYGGKKQLFATNSWSSENASRSKPPRGRGGVRAARGRNRKRVQPAVPVAGAAAAPGRGARGRNRHRPRQPGPRGVGFSRCAGPGGGNETVRGSLTHTICSITRPWTWVSLSRRPRWG